jgi:hypothetical protein
VRNRNGTKHGHQSETIPTPPPLFTRQCRPSIFHSVKTLHPPDCTATGGKVGP